MPLTDLESALKSHDTTQFERIYRHFCDPVYSILVRILRNEEEAERLLQKVFVTVWQRANTFDNQHSSLLTWILGIAAREAIEFKSKR